MPGPAIHISVMRHVAKALAEAAYKPERSERVDPNWTGANTTGLGRVMRDHDNFAALGAIGPDIFFFLPDFRDEDGISVSNVLQDGLGPRSGDQYPQLTESALYYDIAFDDDGSVVRRPSYPMPALLRRNG
jgi:hypothetical protein